MKFTENALLYQISLLRDPFSAKPYVEFYATKRVGGEIINHEAVKYIDFTKVEE